MSLRDVLCPVCYDKVKSLVSSVFFKMSSSSSGSENEEPSTSKRLKGNEKIVVKHRRHRCQFASNYWHLPVKNCLASKVASNVFVASNLPAIGIIRRMLVIL